MTSLNLLKIKKIAAWAIAASLTALFLYSAAGKLFIHPEMMDNTPLASWRIIIAMGEIISAILFLVPKTNIYGTVLLSSYMGGAIMVHMMSGTSISFPSFVLILVWIVGLLRNDFFLQKNN